MDHNSIMEHNRDNNSVKKASKWGQKNKLKEKIVKDIYNKSRH